MGLKGQRISHAHVLVVLLCLLSQVELLKNILSNKIYDSLKFSLSNSLFSIK